jgi:hypothetical protein
MYSVRTFFAAVLIGVMLMISAIPCHAAEVDDTSLFVEAYNAHQAKDYLLAIDKIATLNQMFPDTPLRDVTLLLLARAAIKAGDNQLAAKTISQFNTDFATSPLITTIEDELQALAARLSKGELLKPNKQLRAAAEKVRNEQLAQLRAAEQKREQERIAREKAEQERIAKAKADAERKERERIAAEKADKESIKAAITIADEGRIVIAGNKGTVPFTIRSQSKKQETFALKSTSPAEYRMTLHAGGSTDTPVTSITLDPQQNFIGTASFIIPPDKIDGQKNKLSLQLISSRYADISQSGEWQVVTSAPLIRVVAKPAKQSLSPGEQTRYRVTVLNLGSQTAGKQTVRVVLPQQLDFIDAPGTAYRQESAGVFVFSIDSLETGKLAEFNLNVMVRNDSTPDNKLQGTVEVIDAALQQKHSFNSVAATIRKK